MAMFDRLALGIEYFSEYTGRFVAWLVLAMVLLICYDVAMRYLFQSGSVALQELEWHLFAVVFLLGAAYTLKHDGHVRVDMIYQARFMGDKGRAWVDILGILFFLIPFSILIIVSSWPFIENAFNTGEISPDPGGLPYRFIIKSMIPLAFLLLLIQSVAMLIRCVQSLRGKK